MADELGISHQQVHKYEVGRDRIGASRLQQIAAILGVPLRAFFEAPEDAERAAALIGANPRAVEVAWSDKAIMEMGQALAELNNPQARRAFIELCTAVAESKSRQ